MFLIKTVTDRARALLPLHLVTVGTGHIQYPCHRPKGALFHHILLIERGEGVFETPEGTHTLGAGTAVFIRKAYPCSYQARGEVFQTGWVTFDGNGVGALLDYFHAADFAFLNGEQLAPLLRSCCKAAERNAPPEVLSKHVYDMIVSFFSQLNEGQKPSALLEAKDYIEKRYRFDLSVSDVAGAAGISESLLYRLFRQEEGVTPVEYLRKVRIDRAKQQLIESPTLRVAQIAALCGFSDSAYFCKVFREQTNMTPKAYRAAYAL